MSDTPLDLLRYPPATAMRAKSDPQECTEDQVKAMLARSPVGSKLGRWLSCGKGSIAAVCPAHSHTCMGVVHCTVQCSTRAARTWSHMPIACRHAPVSDESDAACRFD